MNLIEQLKRKYQRLPASKKSVIVYTVVGSLFCAFVLSVYYIRGGNSANKQRQAERERKNFELPQNSVAANSWVQSGQVQIEELKKTIGTLSRTIEEMKRDRDNEKKDGGTVAGKPGAATGNEASAVERERSLLDDLKRQGVDIKHGTDIYPPTPTNPAIPGKVTEQPAPRGEQPPAVQGHPPAGKTSGNAPAVSPKPASIMGVYETSDSTTPPPAAAATAAKTESKPWERNFYMPRGTNFKIIMLSGMDVSTAPSNNRSGGKDDGGQLALARVQDLSFLPNEFRQNVSGCFVMVQARGDLTSERAQMRGVGLSCVNRDDEKILDEEIAGFVLDTDGKDGLRGPVVSKRGRFLQAAIFASLIKATGEAFNSIGTSSQYSIRNTTDGGFISSNDGVSMGEGFKRGLGQGVSETANKLVDWYMTQADKLHPIIEIGATREASFIVSQGKSFKFSKNLTEGANQYQNLEGQL